MAFRKSWGFSSPCLSSPQNGEVVSGMKSSSMLCGTGVVALEGCGVDGGACSMYWLVDVGLFKKSDAVGNTNEAVGEGISASSVDGEAGRN